MENKITVNRLDQHVNFEAIDQSGQSILMDGSEAIGGSGNGVRPMQTLLMGLAGCSGIDVVLILKKMKQVIDDIKIDIEAEVEKVDEHKIYKTIDINFRIWGDIKESKVERAVKLSIDKYCSVAKALDPISTINYSFELNPK